jgi:UPF0755 protein
LKFFLRLFGILLVVGIAAFAWLWYALNQPYQGFQGAVFLDFPVRTRTSEMAQLLAAKGVVRSEWMFTAARALSPHSVLQAGEYKFDKPASAFEVFARIVKGDIFYEVLTVPEGQNIFDIAEDLRQFDLIKPADFLAVAKSPALIHDIDPAAPSLEGYLFPDSYRINRHTTAGQLCRTMTTRFRKEWKTLGTTANVHDTVTLASLVEREARRPEERPLVASVFANRLKLGMKLDCDPTTVYAALLEGRYRGTIYKSDLASLNPFNTYQNPGLPPGPIANPGLSSLKAALSPPQTEYVYFVAKGDGSGGHTFSKDLVGHLAATALFRAAQNSAKQ